MPIGASPTLGRVADWISQRGSDVVLQIRAQPGVSHPGISVDAEAGWVKVRLNAPAVDGRANTALVAALAKKLRVPKSSVTITHGATGRTKTVQIRDAEVSEVRAALSGDR